LCKILTVTLKMARIRGRNFPCTISKAANCYIPIRRGDMGRPSRRWRQQLQQSRNGIFYPVLVMKDEVRLGKEGHSYLNVLRIRRLNG